MDLLKLPESTRLKLSEGDEHQLWEEAEELGLKTAADRTGFKPHNVYSWRSEKSFLPKRFVEEFLTDPEVSKMKGEGRGKSVDAFEIESIPAELLTRVQESVSVNSDGVPFYQNSDIGCALRFASLLEDLGIPYSSYSRDVYEVRYPKIVHEIFRTIDFQTSFDALVDESGRFEADELVAGKRSMPLEEFDGELYSRSKKLELALAKQDSDEIERLMAGEVARIQEAFSG